MDIQYGMFIVRLTKKQDTQIKVRKIQAVFKEEESKDKQKKKPGHIRFAPGRPKA